MARLSIDSVVKVNVGVAPVNMANANGNNIGLIIGTTNVITAADRVKVVTNLEGVASLGFAATDPEYLAASMYFSQNPKPSKLIIGRRVTGSPGETAAEALAACRDANEEFYGVYICGATDADVVAAVTEAETLGLTMVFFDTNNTDAVVASPTNADVFTTLHNAGKVAGIGIYSNTDYAGAALMGLAMGLEDGTDASAFDLYFQNLAGVPTMAVTETGITNLLAKGGNVYIQRGQSTKLIDNGQCIDGTPYDETMYLDLTQKILRQYVLEVLTSTGTRKVPQTDDGMALILSAVTSGMEYMKRIGFCAPGVWTAQPFESINTGDVLAMGYQVFADSFDNMSAADRAARKAPPVYVAMKLAGSVRSVVINVNVNE